MAQRPFTWWWPSSGMGQFAFGVVIGVSALTLVMGPFGVINIAFWYLVAVGVRFVYIKANGLGPTSTSQPASAVADKAEPSPLPDGDGADAALTPETHHQSQ